MRTRMRIRVLPSESRLAVGRRRLAPSSSGSNFRESPPDGAVSVRALPRDLSLTGARTERRWG